MEVGVRARVLRSFASLPDPRMKRTRKHELPDLLVIAICASLGGADGWAALSSAVCVESLRRIDGDKPGEQQEQRDRRYYIASIGKLDAQRMLGYSRGHWGVENGLHWCLDVSFDEDRRRIRKDHGAENFSRLSRIALNLLKQERTAKVGIKSKRLRCGWDHDYLLKVLTQGN